MISIKPERSSTADQAGRSNCKDRFTRFHAESCSGFGFSMRDHSPLNALTSQLERPMIHISSFQIRSVPSGWGIKELTFIDQRVAIVEKDAVV